MFYVYTLSSRRVNPHTNIRIHIPKIRQNFRFSFFQKNKFSSWTLSANVEDIVAIPVGFVYQTADISTLLRSLDNGDFMKRFPRLAVHLG